MMENMVGRCVDIATILRRQGHFIRKTGHKLDYRNIEDVYSRFVRTVKN